MPQPIIFRTHGQKATENYLGSFEQRVKKEFAQKPEVFKKNSEELEVD